MAGRFFWSSVSDYIGRKNTYTIFFVLGFGVIMSMYGGGFTTIPAYLRDLFGTMQSVRFTGDFCSPGRWRRSSGRCL